MNGLTVGRMVHFINLGGTHCAAIVTKVVDKEKGVVNLNVMNPEGEGVPVWSEREVSYHPASAALKGLRTWHWIEPA